MSVNGLGSVSKECDDVERNYVPLKLERDRVHNVDVQGDQQTSGTLVPTGMRKSTPDHVAPPAQARGTTNTHHKAVAAKHIVLPTYMGSRSALKGKPSTR